MWASGMRVMVRHRETEQLMQSFSCFCPECCIHTLTWINGIWKPDCFLTGVPLCVCVCVCVCVYYACVWLRGKWCSLLQGSRMNVLSRGDFWFNSVFLNRILKNLHHPDSQTIILLQCSVILPSRWFSASLTWANQDVLFNLHTSY